MADEQLETRIVMFVDVPFRVVGKRIKKGFFGEKFIVSCYSDHLKADFRLKTTEPQFHRLQTGIEYTLYNRPVFQQYDQDGRPVGESFVEPSNMVFG